MALFTGSSYFNFSDLLVHLKLKLFLVLSASQLSFATLVPNVNIFFNVTCPGEAVILTCTLSGSVARWNVVPPPETDFAPATASLTMSGESMLIGSEGFMFGQVNLTNTNGDVTSILTTVTEVESLEGSIVTCGAGGDQTVLDPLTIQVADPPSQPLSPTLISFQNGTTTSVVTLQWSPPSSPDGVDVSYVLTISPTPVSGSPVTVQSNSVEITVSYNILNNVTIRADNCAGSSGGIVVMLFELVNCFQPSTAEDGVILPNIGTTTEGSSFMFNSNVMETSVCGSDGNWSPDPSNYNCQPTELPTGPPVTCTAPGTPFNGSVDIGVQFPRYPLGSMITFRCDNGLFPAGLMTSTCVNVEGEGVWVDDPAVVMCRDMPVNCSLPAEPRYGTILDYDNFNVTVIEGTMLTFQCDPGFLLNGEMTITCTNAGEWSTDPDGLECTAHPGYLPVAPLSTGAAVGVTAIVTFFVTAITAFLAGLLVMYLMMRKKATFDPSVVSTDSPSPPPPGPVYEEVSTPKENIELETNLAYGPVRH